MFVLLAAISVGSVFYIKNYYFYSAAREKVDENQITINQTMGLISENREHFQTYDGKVISADKLPLIPEEESHVTEKLILHFWASWCDPCVNEIPELLMYLKSHASEINSGKWKIALVSVDYELSAIEKFLKSFPQLNDSVYLQLWDPDGYLQKSFNIDRLPATIIVHKNPIDDKGKIVERYMAVVNWKQMP